MKLTKTHAVLVVVVACLILSASNALAAFSGVQIPTVVNVYPNANVTQADIDNAIQKANDILKQADMKLVVVKTNNLTAGQGGDDGSGSGTAGDGSFTCDERDKAREFGGKEIDNLPSKKGIKISFGNTPTSSSPTNPGVSIHENPTIIVKKRANADETGQTIAHEIGHVMTLGSGHKIDDSSKANNGGHTPNVPGDTGRGNLMAPSDYRNGTHLTPAQIEEMKRNKYKFGLCSVQWERAFPAEKEKQQSGGATDETDDQTSASSLEDIHNATMNSVLESDYIEADVTVGGVLQVPSADYQNLDYFFGFNADGDMLTGGEIGSVTGVDYAVHVHIEGSILDGTMTMNTLLMDMVSGQSLDMPYPAETETQHELFQVDVFGAPAATTLTVRIPKNMLPLTVPQVPVVVASGMLNPVDMVDMVEFVYDQDYWMNRPALNTFNDGVPVPGAPYDFAVSGMTPGSPFELYLDNTLVFSDVLDGSGSFMGSFVFPLSMSNDTINFLTAMDGTTDFAYTITCPYEAAAACFLDADLNMDYYVEWADFGIFATQWQQCTNPEDPSCQPCDILTVN